MISICMAYYNRKKQLLKVLDSINESQVKDYEIIIVDDGSSEEHKLDINQLKSRTNGNVVLLEVDLEKKNWVNACIPFNIAFSRADGDMIVIQNSETYHLGDILTIIKTKLQDRIYLTAHTIALNEIDTENLYNNSGVEEVAKYMYNIVTSTKHLIPGQCPEDGNTIWYNHKNYRPKHYHFLSSITKNDLIALGGFDERYKDDISYDDDELLIRINRLGPTKQFIEDPIAVHLYHSCFYSRSPYNSSKNLALYKNITLRENIIKPQDLNFERYKTFLKEVS